MREDSIKLLNLKRLPGRLTAEEAAPLLGFMSHDIPILVKAKLLKPLGNPPQQAVKFFPALEIEKCAADPDWLSRASRALYAYWQKQNAKRRIRRTVPKTEELLAV